MIWPLTQRFLSHHVARYVSVAPHSSSPCTSAHSQSTFLLHMYRNYLDERIKMGTLFVKSSSLENCALYMCTLSKRAVYMTRAQRCHAFHFPLGCLELFRSRNLRSRLFRSAVNTRVASHSISPLIKHPIDHIFFLTNLHLGGAKTQHCAPFYVTILHLTVEHTHPDRVYTAAG